MHSTNNRVHRLLPYVNMSHNKNTQKRLLDAKSASGQIWGLQALSAIGLQSVKIACNEYGIKFIKKYHAKTTHTPISKTNHAHPTPISADLIGMWKLKGEAPSAVINDNRNFFIKLVKGFRGGKENIFRRSKQKGAVRTRLFAFLFKFRFCGTIHCLFYLSSIFLYMSAITFPAVSFPPSPIANPIPNANAATMP